MQQDIADIIRSNLLAIATAYAKGHGLTLVTVGKRFYGNGIFFTEFRKGKQSISIDKLGAMMRGFRQDWPPETDWPFLPAILMTRGLEAGEKNTQAAPTKRPNQLSSRSDERKKKSDRPNGRRHNRVAGEAQSRHRKSSVRPRRVDAGGDQD